MPLTGGGTVGPHLRDAQPAAVAGLVVLAKLLGRDSLQLHARARPRRVGRPLAAVGHGTEREAQLQRAFRSAALHGQAKDFAGVAIEHGPLKIQRPLDVEVVDGGHERRRHAARPRRRGSSTRPSRRPCPAAAKSWSTTPCRSTSCWRCRWPAARRRRRRPCRSEWRSRCPGAGANGHVDADHVAVDVQQRAARVAGVDAGVGLDQVVVVLGVAHLHGAVQRADDAARDRMFVAVGVAHRDHRLAGHQIGRRADRSDRQRGSAR